MHIMHSILLLQESCVPQGVEALSDKYFTIFCLKLAACALSDHHAAS